MATIKQIILNGGTSLDVNQRVDGSTGHGCLDPGFESAVNYMCGNWNTAKTNWMQKYFNGQSGGYVSDDENATAAESVKPIYFPTDVSTYDNSSQLSNDAKANYFYTGGKTGSYDASTLYLSMDIGIRTVDEPSSGEDGTTSEASSQVPILKTTLHGIFPSLDPGASVADKGHLKIYNNMTYSQALAVLTALYKALIYRPYIFENIQNDDEQTTITDLGDGGLPWPKAFVSDNSTVGYTPDTVVKGMVAKNTSTFIQDFDIDSLFYAVGDEASTEPDPFVSINDYNLSSRIDASTYSSYYNIDSGIEFPNDGDSYTTAIKKLVRLYYIVNVNLPVMALDRVQHSGGV